MQAAKTSGHLNDQPGRLSALRSVEDEAAVKLLYLALRNITTKWQRGGHPWKAALPVLGLLFGPRFTDHA